MSIKNFLLIIELDICTWLIVELDYYCVGENFMKDF